MKILRIKDNIDLKELEKFGWFLTTDRKNNCKYYDKERLGNYIIMVQDWSDIKSREIRKYNVCAYMPPRPEDINLQDIKGFIEEVEVEGESLWNTEN